MKDEHTQYIASLDPSQGAVRRLSEGYEQLAALMGSDCEDMFLVETADKGGNREFFSAVFFWPGGSLGEVMLRPGPNVITDISMLQRVDRIEVHRTACPYGGPYTDDSRVRLVVYEKGAADAAREFKASRENCRKLDAEVLPRFVQHIDVPS